MRGETTIFVWLTSRTAVEESIAECLSIGHDKFLRHYGFGPATTYTFSYGGSEKLDSKAIAAVAYGRQYLTAPLRSDECFGGNKRGQAGWALARLGFEIDGIEPLGPPPDPGRYWIFACNPGRYKIDALMRERLPRDDIDEWGVRPSDEPHFKGGQLGLVRVGRDGRRQDQLAGASKIKAGIYAVCEVLDEPSHQDTASGKNDDLWSDNVIPERQAVPVKYLWWSYENPLWLDTLKERRPDFNEKSVVRGTQLQGGPSFPIEPSDFWYIVSCLPDAADAIAARGSRGAQELRRQSGIRLSAELNDDDIEGRYGQDRTIRFRNRNAQKIAERKKKDNHTCQACHARINVDGVLIIDCHHKYPLREGERIANLDDLICLCPICHRIAHSRSHPLSVEEIQVARQGAGLSGFNI